MHISVDLLKGTYYLNGENIIANIVFQQKTSQDDSNKHRPKTLAWACAQIHCECTFNYDKVKVMSTKNDKSLPKLGLTSLVPNYGEKGVCVYASKPKILVCDLDLVLDEKYKFVYEEVIPFEAFPSYRGLLCKYAYKLTISAQYLSSPVSFVRIPFKVLILQGLSQEIMSNASQDVVLPLNPFLKVDESQDGFSMEKAMALIQDIVSFRNIRHFNITADNDRVCKLSINKTFYKLGESITLYLDFADTSLTCLEVYTSLREDEEILEDDVAIKLKCSSAGSSHNLSTTAGLYAEKRYFLLNTLFVPVTLNVPYSIAPTFTTNLLKHSWKIHFEFTFSPLHSPTYIKKLWPKSPDKAIDSIAQMTGPASSKGRRDFLENLEDDWEKTDYTCYDVGGENVKTSALARPCLTDVETMTWDLPIKIFPSNPVNISSQYPTGKITTVI